MRQRSPEDNGRTRWFSSASRKLKRRAVRVSNYFHLDRTSRRTVCEVSSVHERRIDAVCSFGNTFGSPGPRHVRLTHRLDESDVLLSDTETWSDYGALLKFLHVYDGIRYRIWALWRPDLSWQVLSTPVAVPPRPSHADLGVSRIINIVPSCLVIPYSGMFTFLV